MDKNEAIKIIRRNFPTGRKMLCEALEILIPELKESEDENVRKHLLRHFRNKTKEEWDGMPIKNIISWLEKQKDHEDELEKAYKTADEVQYRKGFEDGVASVKPAEWSEDEKIRKEIIQSIQDNMCVIHKDKCIAWLEKQKDTSSAEYVFRPLAGCVIESAATQAVEQQRLGYKIVLAFNGAYIPVEGKTVNEIVKEYYSWLEKQGRQKPTWSEEDEYVFMNTYELVKENKINPNKSSCAKECLTWLKSLKQRIKGE